MSPGPGDEDFVLELSSDVENISAEGDVYLVPVTGPLGSPVEPNVFVRKTQSRPLRLSPGEYEYQFTVRNADGKFKLTLKRTNGTVVRPEDFDSKVGAAEVFEFTI